VYVVVERNTQLWISKGLKSVTIAIARSPVRVGSSARPTPLTSAHSGVEIFRSGSKSRVVGGNNGDTADEVRGVVTRQCPHLARTRACMHASLSIRKINKKKKKI
jgi:hypothetical protein